MEKKPSTPTMSRVSPVVEVLRLRQNPGQLKDLYIYYYVFNRAKQLACTWPGGDDDI